MNVLLRKSEKYTSKHLVKINKHMLQTLNDLAP